MYEKNYNNYSNEDNDRDDNVVRFSRVTPFI